MRAGSSSPIDSAVIQTTSGLSVNTGIRGPATNSTSLFRIDRIFGLAWRAPSGDSAGQCSIGQRFRCVQDSHSPGARSRPATSKTRRPFRCRHRSSTANQFGSAASRQGDDGRSSPRRSARVLRGGLSIATPTTSASDSPSIHRSPIPKAWIRRTPSTDPMARQCAVRSSEVGNGAHLIAVPKRAYIWREYSCHKSSSWNFSTSLVGPLTRFHTRGSVGARGESTARDLMHRATIAGKLRCVAPRTPSHRRPSAPSRRQLGFHGIPEMLLDYHNTSGQGSQLPTGLHAPAQDWKEWSFSPPLTGCFSFTKPYAQASHYW